MKRKYFIFILIVINCLSFSHNLYANQDIPDKLMTLAVPSQLEIYNFDEAQRLSKILESTSDFVSTSNLDKMITYVNPAGIDMAGLDKTYDINTMRVSDFHSPETFQMLNDIAIPYAIEHGVWRGESRLLRKDGSEIPVSQVIISHRSDEGELLYLSTIIRDISEIENSEHMLRTQHELSKILSSTNDRNKALQAFIQAVIRLGFYDCGGVYEVDHRTKEVRLIFNKGLREDLVKAAGLYTFEHPNAKIVLKGEPLFGAYSSLIPAQDAIRKKEGLKSFAILPLKCNGVVVVDVNLSSHRYEELPDIIKESILSMVMQIEKFMERIQTEEFLNNIVNSIDDPIFVKDEKHLWVMLNDKACELFGHKREELLGKTDYEIFPKQESDVFWEKDNKVFETGETDLNEEEITSVGETKIISTKKSLYVNPSTGKKYIVGIIRDITERKKAELTIIAEQKVKNSEDFLAAMSHDIRTPLNTIIIMGIDLLLGDEKITREQRKLLEDVSFSSSTLLTLINDILDLSKIKSGKLNIDKAPCDLKNNILKLQNMMALSASKKGVSLEVKLPGLNCLEGSLVICDWDRLNRVLINLIGNAIKFTPAGNTVSVEINLKDFRESSCRLEFKIKDTGIGIEQGQTEKIFNEFVQASESVSRTFGGTGLGLSISQKLIALMSDNKEKIYVESGGKGLGSCFSFELEFCIVSDDKKDFLLDESKAYLKSLKEMKSSADIKILLAEDNIVNQRVMAAFLKNIGFQQIDIAENGKSAYEKFLESAASVDSGYDIILMDCQMPVMDGYEATKEILSYCSKNDITPPRIIALTANAMEGNKETCFKSGMHGYLNKPLKKVSFEEELKRFFDIQYILREKSKDEDITDKPAIENSASEEFDNFPLPGAIYEKIDDDFILVGFNRSFSNLTDGMVRNFLKGSYKICFQSNPEMIKDIDECYSRRTTINKEVTTAFKPGEVRDWRLTYGYIPPNKVIVYIEDIREISNALKKVDQEQRFLSQMSHDLRTPFNPILGYLELLSKTRLTIEQKEYIGDIKSSVNTMTTIVEDILELSRLKAGQIKLEINLYDIKKELIRFYSIIHPIAVEKGIKFNIQIDKNIPDTIYCDWNRLSRVFMNLIVDAIEHTPANGNVDFEIINKKKYEQKDVLIGFKINNTDIGEGFSLAADVSSDKNGMSGIGISIVKRILDLMYVKNILHSDREGKGNTVYFELKFKVSDSKSGLRSSTFANLRINSNRRNIIKSKMKILIVEDNVINQRIVVSMLKRLHLSSDFAQDGLIGIEMFKQNCYDLILMDCQMPNKDGYEATREILTYCEERDIKEPVIIALTANALPEDRKKCAQAGMHDFLAKPLSIDMLEGTIEKYFNFSLVNSLLTIKDVFDEIRRENKNTSNCFNILSEVKSINNKDDINRIMDIVLDLKNIYGQSTGKDVRISDIINLFPNIVEILSEVEHKENTLIAREILRDSTHPDHIGRYFKEYDAVLFSMEESCEGTRQEILHLCYETFGIRELIIWKNYEEDEVIDNKILSLKRERTNLNDNSDQTFFPFPVEQFFYNDRVLNLDKEENDGEEIIIIEFCKKFNIDIKKLMPFIQNHYNLSEVIIKFREQYAIANNQKGHKDIIYINKSTLKHTYFQNGSLTLILANELRQLQLKELPEYSIHGKSKQEIIKINEMLESDSMLYVLSMAQKEDIVLLNKSLTLYLELLTQIANKTGNNKQYLDKLKKIIDLLNYVLKDTTQEILKGLNTKEINIVTQLETKDFELTEVFAETIPVLCAA